MRQKLPYWIGFSLILTLLMNCGGSETESNTQETTPEFIKEVTSKIDDAALVNAIKMA